MEPGLNLPRRCFDRLVAQMNLPDAPGEQIVAQNPPANASGIAAPKINLLISAGAAPEMFVMPNLTGQPLGSATLAVQDASMHIGKVLMAPVTGDQTQNATNASSEPNPASMVVTQSPGPGQKIAAGSAVNFEVR